MISMVIIYVAALIMKRVVTLLYQRGALNKIWGLQTEKTLYMHIAVACMDMARPTIDTSRTTNVLNAMALSFIKK